MEELADTTQQTLSLLGSHVRWRVGKGVEGTVEEKGEVEDEGEAGGAAKAIEVKRRRNPIVSLVKGMASEGKEGRNFEGDSGVGEILKLGSLILRCEDLLLSFQDDDGGTRILQLK